MAKSLISKRTELEELQYKSNQITDESLECTRRMLNMVVESEDAGRRTTEALEVQRQQLNSIEQNMDHINADVSKAEVSLRKLKSCCYSCPTPWKNVAKQVENESEFHHQTQQNRTVVIDQPRRTDDTSEEMLENGTWVNPPTFITPITNDDREVEMNINLNQVNSIVGNLRNMAVDMNTELKAQNTQIERITRKGDANNIRLDQVNISATKIVNS